MNRTILKAMTIVLMLFSWSCIDRNDDHPISLSSPISPSLQPGIGSTSLNSYEWSPYIVIHAPREALRVYEEAVSLLIRRDNLKGARVGIVKGEGLNVVIRSIGAMGVELLGIVDNYYLIEDSRRIEETMDNIIRTYPEIRYFQIGNEITTILPNSPRINMKEYMSVFSRIYYHVVSNYPHITLLTHSTTGLRSRGARELEEMASFGLANMDPARVIIGINVYSIAGNRPNVLNTSLRSFRVWITETGINNQNEHLLFFRDIYPRLKSIFRAERIYWYTLYANTGDKGFSLIDIVRWPNGSSQLFNLLTGNNLGGAR